MRAFDAFDLLSCKPIELMRFFDIFLIKIFGIIMAESACEEFVALLALFQAASLVVFAAILHDLVRLLPFFHFFLDFLFLLR